MAMPMKPASLSIPNELPPCDGPKLRLFEHHNSRIQWLERLGNDEESQSHVFRVKIKRREYAIKVFKFFDPRDEPIFWRTHLGKETPLNTVAYYLDPFYCECRAYGRIHEIPKRDHQASNAAIHCHGFLFLDEKDEQILKDMGYNLAWNKTKSSYQDQTIGGYRLRAIVKDLASPDPGVTGTTLKKILARIVALNRHKIYVQDIWVRNFRDGKLVDFGNSWTEPHIILNAMNERQASARRRVDRMKFNEMVELEEIPNPNDIIAGHSMQLRRAK